MRKRQELYIIFGVRMAFTRGILCEVPLFCVEIKKTLQYFVLFADILLKFEKHFAIMKTLL